MPQGSDEEDVESRGTESEDINRNLFKDQDGFRIAFYFHKSINKPFARRNLTRNIERHGGVVLDTEIGCDTVLVDATYDKKETLQISYNTDDDPRLRKIFVERASFVQHCIYNDRFVHRITALKGMGGTVGRKRTEFTQDDDENLCRYLARVLPDKAAGGRLGLEVYKKLVGTATVRGTHTWGARHTAESWKERYKKNASAFDKWIEDRVKQEGRSRKQLWPEDRRVTQKALRGRHKHEPEADSSEENYDEEEFPQPPRKPRRSDYEENYKEEEYSQSPRNRRRSDYSSPHTNRRRVVQRSSDQQVRIRSSGSRKGKAPVLEEEEEDTDREDQLEHHVDQDEPGPSRSQRSLEATNANAAVDVLTHRTQPNTASFFTQETIVATTPRGKSTQKEASNSPDEVAGSSSLVRESIQVLRRAKQVSPAGPIAIIDLTSPSGSIGRDSPAFQLSPTRTLVNPAQTQRARSPTYKRPLKAARRPRAMIEAATLDAPFRNTRSRSRSVEPYARNSPIRRSKRRSKETREKRPSLATVDEIQEDGKQDNNENLGLVDEPMPLPLGEILSDEVDVEKMLISDDTNQDEEPYDVTNLRGVSLDTDDAQTEQNLRLTHHSQVVFSSLHKHPSDMLREFQESSATMMNQFNLVPLTARPHLSDKPAVPDPHKASEPPRTPPRRRKNSASSAESFPVSGTRASALKKKLQQEEKRSLYKPPGGTRAAKFARSRR